MKILFSGGGSGGHFYPIIAVAEEINNIVKEKKLVKPSLYYLAPDPYNEKLLFENNIVFKKNPAGKLRRYFSILNFFDLFKTFYGIIKAIFRVFFIFPDVIFSKGGYASFPIVLAAKLFRIPLVIHESDSVPGRVNKWSGKFAKKIAVSFPEAGNYFPKDKVANTGNPVRSELYTLTPGSAHEFLKLEENIPVILVLGGSQGAETMNDLIIDSLPELLKRYQVIHQTGRKNFEQIKITSDLVLGDSKFKHRYRPVEYLETLSLRMAAGASSMIISRGGSTIFEIAIWKKPSIIIPLKGSSNDHQHKNAFSYARSNAAVVIEEGNLTPNILIAEVDRILGNPELIKSMIAGARKFAHKDSARIIAEVIVDIALEHEKK